MNKTVLMAGVGVGAIIILGLGGFFFLNKNKSNSPEQVTQESEAETQMAGAQSFKDLMKLSSSQTCTFQDTETGSNGTVYGGSGKVRGDFTTQANGQTVGSHVISDGQTVYVWTDGQTQGMKMSLASIESMTPDTTNKNSVDFDKKVDYDCDSWSVDFSKFELPSGVEFQSMDEMMQESMGQPKLSPAATSSGSSTAPNCSACDNVPAAAQAQCRQAMGC
jgi:hypothetical protein